MPQVTHADGSENRYSSCRMKYLHFPANNKQKEQKNREAK
ncbi:hypothetical protein EVA_04400 [gut metagenome]|uniref:Uncharacterized protein n=1 Tax=gut metagenome TaxID=749906 RepID=J9H1Z5_9ZZZZ